MESMPTAASVYMGSMVKLSLANVQDFKTLNVEEMIMKRSAFDTEDKRLPFQKTPMSASHL